MGTDCYSQICNDCGSSDVVTDYGAGDVICRSCGMILNERIVDDTPEWRVFANDDRGADANEKSRTGQAQDERFGDADLSSVLVCNKDDPSVKNNRILSKVNKDSSKMLRIQSIISRIREISDALELPKIIVEIAMELYAQLESQDHILRGAEKESCAAAILFIACRQSGYSRSFKEIEQASGVSKKRIGKSFLAVKKHLKVDVQQAASENYVERYCSRLGLPSKTQVIAHNVAKKAEALGLCHGKCPTAVAASVIYLVAAYTNDKRSIQEISHVTMIAVPNVKKMCKELIQNRTGLFEGVHLEGKVSSEENSQNHL